ncbi:Dienelactone hydrolase [Bosea sp. TND4EK4]|nr:Dienelactone hydrolase [Bosea sp. TND4EK4]
MSSLWRLLACMFSLVLTVPLALASGYERVEIPMDGGLLDGVMFRPAGTGPFPAVVALHGCGGLWREPGKLSLRHSDWGERLAATGFVVLMPDSYGSRGLGSQCGVKDLTVRAGRERTGDVAAARLFLQQRADVRPAAISLIGWSGGGSTVLNAVRKDKAPNDGKPDFRRAVTFYPGCRAQSETPSFAVRMPLLILMGADDDWTPVAPCSYLTRAAQMRGEAVELVTYPGAVHDFDHPRLDLKERENVAFSASGTGKVTVGTNPAARADALKRVESFLKAN